MRYEPLSEPERRGIHDAALLVLEETGLQIDPVGRAAARLRDLGIRIATDGRMRLPRERVAAALAQAPRVVRLGGRDPSRVVTLDGSRTYVATDGCGSRTVDPLTGEVRASSLADVAGSARLADALDAYHVYWNMVSAQDVPLQGRVAREFLAATRNTTKHVQMIDVCKPGEARDLARMAQAMEESGAASGPPVSLLISVVSPLRLDPPGLEAARVFAEAGLPVVCTSMPIAGVTAPATAPGTLLMAHAEVVGFAAVLQMLHPGAPLIDCAFPAFAEPRTGTTNYRDPRRSWAAAAAAQMGALVNLPAFVSGEVASLMARPDMVCFGGLLEVSTLLSFEQMVIDDEILHDWTIAAGAHAIDGDSLAVDVIQQVGPGGHFLARKHTGRHIREFMVHRYSDPDRAVEPGAAARAGERPRDLARREAMRLLGTHVPAPLPEPASAALTRLVDEAARG